MNIQVEVVLSEIKSIILSNQWVPKNHIQALYEKFSTNSRLQFSYNGRIGMVFEMIKFKIEKLRVTSIGTGLGS